MATHLVPIEIWESICLRIDEPSDLLVLAPKFLCTLIIPSHIQFRYLRCDFRRAELWRLLASRSDLAQGLRVLEITTEAVFTSPPENATTKPWLPSAFEHQITPQKSNLPQEVLTIHFDHCLSLLSGAVRGMLRLKTFRWLIPIRPVNLIYGALENCPDLERVEVFNYDELKRKNIADVDLGSAPLWRLSNLKHFSFEEYHSRANITVTAYQSYVNALADFLLSCKNLVELRINHHHLAGFEPNESDSLDVSPIQHLFTVANWPHLKHLSIETYALQGTSGTFFRAHQKLESLSFKASRRAMRLGSIFITGLPYLQSLDVPCMINASHVSHEIMAGLTHLAIVLKIPWPTSQDIAGSFHMALKHLKATLKMTENLKSLVLYEAFPGHDLLRRILKRVPPLEKLIVNWRLDRPSFINSPRLIRLSAVPEISMTKKAIPLIQNLTYFGRLDPSWPKIAYQADYPTERVEERGVLCGFAMDITPSYDSDLAGLEYDVTLPVVLRILCTAAPRLTFVEIDEWVTIKRDEHGNYVGYETANGRPGCNTEN